MRIFIVGLIFLQISVCVYAKSQESDDHLFPVRGVLADDGNVAYHQAIRQTLLTDRIRIVQMVETPSFKAEKSVYIVSGADGAKVYYREVIGNSIWGQIMTKLESDSKNGSYSISNESMGDAFKKLKIEFKESTYSISSENLALLEQVWRLALRQVSYPVTDVHVLDGVSFQFSTWERGVGFREGEINSPKENSKMGKLVKLGHQLMELTLSTEKTGKDIEKQLHNEASSLLKELRK